MKRITLTALCVIFSVALFAQKALIIHKKDGTKIEYPINAIEGFDFTGKAVVNDGEYISLSGIQRELTGTYLDITLTIRFHSDNPYIKEATPSYGNNWGILYSTNPNVTIETGELIPLERGQTSTITNLANAMCFAKFGESAKIHSDRVDLEFETTYYIRSFVRSNDKLYYSKEASINTGKPTMAYYGADVDPAKFEKTGYIMPTESAWASLAERSQYFKNEEAVIAVWNDYLTAERIAALKPKCSTVHECSDGMLYILDNIDDDFIEYVISLYTVEFTTSGYTEDISKCDNVEFVECDESWNIPNNSYWQYTPSSSSVNPKTTFTLNKPLLANYYHKIEVTFAPDVTLTDTLPTKYRIDFKYLNELGKTKTENIAIKQLTNVQETTIATFDSISTGSFGEAMLIIEAQVTSREIKTYSRKLRISQIKVIPMGPINKEEE